MGLLQYYKVAIWSVHITAQIYNGSMTDIRFKTEYFALPFLQVASALQSLATYIKTTTQTDQTTGYNYASTHLSTSMTSIEPFLQHTCMKKNDTVMYVKHSKVEG